MAHEVKVGGATWARVCVESHQWTECGRCHEVEVGGPARAGRVWSHISGQCVRSRARSTFGSSLVQGAGMRMHHGARVLRGSRRKTVVRSVTSPSKSVSNSRWCKPYPVEQYYRISRRYFGRCRYARLVINSPLRGSGSPGTVPARARDSVPFGHRRRRPSRRNGRLAAMKSVSRRRLACLPIVHIYCAVVVAIVVESTKGLEYYCSTPR